MKNQIPLIAIAVFAITILLSQAFYIQPAIAQLTFTTTTISYTGNVSDQSNCHYIDSEESWCSSTSGVKIINPTSQAIVQTLFSGIEVQDLDCTTTYCYSWHGGGTVTGNLTKWTISTRTVNNSTTFTISGGANIGRQIDALNAQGAENILVGASSGCNTGSTSTKGLCIMNGDGNLLQTARFISSGDTGAAAVLFNVKWSETLATVGEPTLNNALIAFQDGAGTRTIKIINLSDPDTTFATTQTCSTTFSTLGATEMFQIFVYNENYYIPNDAGATGAYGEVPIDSTTCTVTNRYPTTWDVPVALITDGEFFYTASYDGATSKSAFQVYNSSSVALATYNITNTSAPALPVKNGWYHSTEGEVQILGNNRLIVFVTQDVPSGGGGGTGGGAIDCNLPENENILICRLGGDGTLGSAGAFVIGNTTQGTGILGIGCSIGLVDCTSDSNPQTNGLGILIFIASIFVIVGMFYRSLGASATFQLPVFIWVMIIVALSAFFTITEIIDPVFLILSIVAVIALAAPKVIGVIQNRGGGFGGGGSTE